MGERESVLQMDVRCMACVSDDCQNKNNRITQMCLLQTNNQKLVNCVFLHNGRTKRAKISFFDHHKAITTTH